MHSIKYYIDILNKQEKPFKFLFSRILWKTGLSKLIILDRKLYKIRFYPTSISVEVWDNPNSRRSDEDIFTAYLKPGDTVVDVGANIGILTLVAAVAVGNNGNVFSIEPHPVIFKYLRGNINLNRFKNIQLFNTAVGDKQGVVYFSDKHYDTENEIVLDGKLKIAVSRLDDLLNKRVEKVDLLKVDVEGFEKFVFLGSPQLLEKTKFIYYESINMHAMKRNYKTIDIFKIIVSSGFNIYKIKNREITLASEKDILEQNHTNNLLAIRNIGDFCERIGNRYQIKS